MKKILVIFSFAIILSIIIYRLTFNSNIKVLVIGENDKSTFKIINELKDRYEVNTFLYDSINYKELLKSIYNNDYVIIKDKKVLLNQLIASSNIVVINVNNKIYKKRCLDNMINNLYINNIDSVKREINSVIDKISFSKVYFISNNCNNNDILEYIKDL